MPYVIGIAVVTGSWLKVKIQQLLRSAYLSTSPVVSRFSHGHELFTEPIPCPQIPNIIMTNDIIITVDYSL